MFLLGIILGTFIGVILMALISIDTINDYEKQNNNLLNACKRFVDEKIKSEDKKYNAEIRATKFARIIKKVEDIVLSQKSNEDKCNEIKKLVTDRKSEN